MNPRAEFRLLLKQAWPMLLALFAIGSVELADAFYLSYLGPLTISAFTYALPMIGVVLSVWVGFGIGVTSLVSRGGAEEANKDLFLVMLAIILIAVCLMAGLFFLSESLYTLIGGVPETVPNWELYWWTYLWGCPVLGITIVGTAWFRGLGDAKTSRTVFLVSAAANFVLDPILIFGLFGLPALGIQGAALATILANALSAICLLVQLYRTGHFGKISVSFRRVRELLEVALPATVGQYVVPLSGLLLITMCQPLGVEYLAALGFLIVCERFAFNIPLSAASMFTPFAGRASTTGSFEDISKVYLILLKFWLGLGGILTAFVTFAIVPASSFAGFLPTGVATALPFVSLVVVCTGIVQFLISAYNGIGAGTSALVLSVGTRLLFVPLAGFIGLQSAGWFGFWVGLWLGAALAAVVASLMFLASVGYPKREESYDGNV